MTNHDTLRRHAFRSMGSEIEVLLLGASPSDVRWAFARAEAVADLWMRTFSRFDPSSELSRLNASQGRPVEISDYLYRGIEMALWGARITGGLFDPTVHDALIAAGYDRPFTDVPSYSANLLPSYRRAPGIEGVILDAARRTVTLPKETRLDLGGMAKGLYASVLAASFSHLPGGIVSAGGDMHLWGTGPDRGGWTVGIENPASTERDVARIRVTNAAIATSGTNRRTWYRGARELHHLIDPATGLPAKTGVRSVTVIATAAHQAEIASTALFVCGCADRPPGWIWNLISSAIIIKESGEVLELHPAQEHFANERHGSSWALSDNSAG